uniref:Uncharacterized protein n=1 Tax=Fundulus heteroclitus TaxID=8078 RepID=A0A3Q2PIM8_FUNHE
MYIFEPVSVVFTYLESDIKHHRSDEVNVRESDSQPPCQIKKYQQSPRQAFAKHSVGPTSGAREPEHQVRQTRHVGSVRPALRWLTR